MGRKGYSIQQRFFSSAFTVVCQTRRHRKNDRNLLLAPCLSPWSIISSCCRFSSKKTKEENKKVVENRSEQEDGGLKYGEIAESVHGGGSSSSLKGSGLSEQGREVCFNLGVGFGVIHLIAASSYELNKMVQLCKQMETLVQDLKKIPSQNAQKDHSEPSIGSSADATINTTQIEAQQGRRYSLQTENPPDVVVDVQKSYSNLADMDLKAKAKKKMDRLEEELEVELEHLQMQLDSEIMANCAYTTEISVEDSAPEESFDEQAFEIEQTESEVIIINDMENNNNGVSPVELERRLHELLAMRQEKKIKALESALDSAVQKLRENQKELS